VDSVAAAMTRNLWAYPAFPAVLCLYAACNNADQMPAVATAVPLYAECGVESFGLEAWRGLINPESLTPGLAVRCVPNWMPRLDGFALGEKATVLNARLFDPATATALSVRDDGDSVLHGQLVLRTYTLPQAPVFAAVRARLDAMASYVIEARRDIRQGMGVPLAKAEVPIGWGEESLYFVSAEGVVGVLTWAGRVASPPESARTFSVTYAHPVVALALGPDAIPLVIHLEAEDERSALRRQLHEKLTDRRTDKPGDTQATPAGLTTDP